MDACPERRVPFMPPLVAQALLPAVSRLVSTRCRPKSVPMSGDAAGRSACATRASSRPASVCHHGLRPERNRVHQDIRNPRLHDVPVGHRNGDKVRPLGAHWMAAVMVGSPASGQKFTPFCTASKLAMVVIVFSSE